VRQALDRVLAPTSSRRSTCPPTTTRPWTAGRCAAPTSPRRTANAPEEHRHRLCRRAFEGKSRCRRGGADHDRRRAAGGRRHRGHAGSHPGRRRPSSSRRASRPGRTRAAPAKTCRPASPRIPAGRKLRPAEIGLIASLGRPKCRCAAACAWPSSPPATNCARIGEPLAEGAVYDSNRYTLWGMLTRLGCEVIDMGVVRDDPPRWKPPSARPPPAPTPSSPAAASRSARPTSSSAGDGPAGRSAVLEDRHEARAGRWPSAASSPGGSATVRRLAVRPAGQPGGGDGHLLPVRAPGPPQAGRLATCRVPCRCFRALHRGHEEEARPHRVPARHPHARKTALAACAPPARRARACCARWPMPTASSCWNTSAEKSALAIR
jgi:hypothetical protein